jgi:protocatechuate 3,4-dioxygenase beta subunit
MKGHSRAATLVVLAAPPLLGSEVHLAHDDAPSTAAVAPPAEPGQRLEVKGVVYARDGRTPVPRASVYVYQTDARGYYRPDDAMGNRDPRLKALLRTDAAGRYSFTTIRPGSYPGSRVPQHIHYEVAADGHASLSSRSCSTTIRS